MNYVLVFKLLSFIAMIVAVAFGLSTCVSLYYSGNPLEAGASESWITSFALAIVVALILYLPGRDSSKKLFKKEAMCVVGLGWFLSSLLGSVPYMLIYNCGFFDAFFESVSGFTATGASVFGNLESIPESLLFFRALTQWIGGLGVVVFFVALLSSLGAGAKVLYTRESNMSTEAFERGKIKSGIWRILRIYLFLSVLCAVSYKLCGMSVYDAVCHMFATVSTGGFSTKTASIAAFGSYAIEWVAIVFMFMGGVSFSVLLMFLNKDWTHIKKNTEFKAYICLVLVYVAIIFVSIFDYSNLTFGSFAKTFTDSSFQVVSLITSTGFSTADYQSWPSVAHVIIFLMFITGACAGSTSGGLKIFRAVGVFKIALSDIEKSFRPNVVRPLRLNGKLVSDENARHILSFLALYAIVFVLGLFLLSAVENSLSFTACLYSVVSALSNIGPAMNETGPMFNYGFLNSAAKFILSLLMIIGRLEFYAVLVLFMPSLWKKFK